MGQSAFLLLACVFLATLIGGAGSAHGRRREKNRTAIH